MFGSPTHLSFAHVRSDHLDCAGADAHRHESASVGQGKVARKRKSNTSRFRRIVVRWLGIPNGPAPW
ncbi:predicted protein [Chaetomium globosum CBS 148.51]|uniref:Uncharacterized protein n=1 Tax=Chaetomium globosum (strain ATCC 6205 / CBS 148.51 / DSM 1962 / NBRC 6347 / NRRL 1970) TaxID=306901 RepID=Q2H0K9_CHAGB|nr:uncharacterized protein CHGG_04687 [Chaetomium globosum CBS 148.51]EAQ88068.1 predicted protein [Chaetomium globosum CBS 148.51]